MGATLSMVTYPFGTLVVLYLMSIFTELKLLMYGLLFLQISITDLFFCLTRIGNPIGEIRRSYYHLISPMFFPTLVRRHLFIESAPMLSIFCPLTGSPQRIAVMLILIFIANIKQDDTIPALWWFRVNL